MTALAVIRFCTDDFPTARIVMHDNLFAHPYICGIGGIGMSGVAHLLIDMGISVVGSDLRHSILTQELEDRGAVIKYEPDPLRVRNASCIIAPSSFPATHPELEAAREAGIVCLSRSRALAQLCHDAECVPSLCFGTTARGKLTRLASCHSGFGWCAGAAIASPSASRHAVLAHQMMIDIDEREFLADPEAFRLFPELDILVSDWQNDGFGYYGNDPRFQYDNFVKSALEFQNGTKAFLVMPQKDAQPEHPEFCLWQESRILERFVFDLDFEHGVLKSPKSFEFDDVPVYGTRFDAAAVAAAQTWLFARQLPGLRCDFDCVGWFNRISNNHFHDIRMHPVNVHNAVDSLKRIATTAPIHVAIKPFSSTLKYYSSECWIRALSEADHIFVISPPYEGCCIQDCLDFAKELRHGCPNVDVISLEDAHRRAGDNDFWLWIGADDLV